jgi:cellulose biosynthesis protein BcsQ
MSKVVTFFSSLSNVGTTSTVLSTAYALANYSDQKIGVLLLNAWDDGTDFYTNPPYYLNELKSRLAGKMFENDEDFLGKFKTIYEDRLFILAGNQDRRMERLFIEEEVEYLLERAREVFDLVLIDAGCHFDNALTVISVNKADMKVLICNQQAKAVKRFHQIYDDILFSLGIDKQDLHLVVNQYQDHSFLPTDKDISKQLNVPLLVTVDFEATGWLAELENKILFSYDYPLYQDAIMVIAKKIAETFDIPLKEVERKRKGLALARLFG